MTLMMGAQQNARRALAWREAGRKGGTPVGVESAQLLARGRWDPDRDKRAWSFFRRFEATYQQDQSTDEDPSRMRVSWNLWGGDAMYEHLKRERERQDAEENPRDFFTGHEFEARKGRGRPREYFSPRTKEARLRWQQFENAMWDLYEKDGPFAYENAKTFRGMLRTMQNHPALSLTRKRKEAGFAPEEE